MSRSDAFYLLVEAPKTQDSEGCFLPAEKDTDDIITKYGSLAAWIPQNAKQPYLVSIYPFFILFLKMYKTKEEEPSGFGWKS